MSESDDASPQVIRERLERSYLDSYRRMGLNVDEWGARQQAIQDLEIVDAARRAGELEPPVVSAETEYQPREKPQEILDAEAETGMVLLDDRARGEAVRFREMDANPLFTSERWALAGGRIKRILEGSGGSSDVMKAVETATLPKLAREYAETWFFFMRRDRYPIRETKNPFDGLSDVDACRLLVRKVEDICDRSTGSMGPWFVPK